MKVELTKSAEKQLRKSPEHIQVKFEYWIDLLITVGLRNARKYKGFHDELLKGRRKGQRSVRLSKGYRAIYREAGEVGFEVIEIIEVNKHEY